jgi:hypothetical protein
MHHVLVECLRCGLRHTLARSGASELTDSECPRCGYLGWAHAASLDEPARRRLRDWPLELRVRAHA